MPVFVVSLKTATDRRAALKSHLDDLGIRFEWFDAIRGDQLSLPYRQQVNPVGNMSPGQLGCYLSHIHIYEQIIAQALPVALILEDDAVLHPSVKNLIETGCLNLDFDYCFLGSDDCGDAGYVYYDAAKPSRLSTQHMAFPLSSGPFCLHAYCITLEGAKKRVACAYPLRRPIDHYHDLPYRPRMMTVVPMVAFVNELSAVQSMSSLNWSGLQTRARKYRWYYPLRDLLKLKFVRKLIALQRTPFPHPGQWRALESAFKVVRKSRLKNVADANWRK
ncbi:glycosyltransferase family 25 protein [Rhodoferax antarcticus]|nr:glycosyltransferase family 25 protein [Rhodoferax antarcticus]APW45077.1 hypothetical protein RA876_00330 [Rhodoferax antarcticus]